MVGRCESKSEIGGSVFMKYFMKSILLIFTFQICGAAYGAVERRVFTDTSRNQIIKIEFLTGDLGRLTYNLRIP